MFSIQSSVSPRLFSFAFVYSNCSLLLMLFCNLWDKVRISVLKFLQTQRPLSNPQEKKQLFSHVKVDSYECGKFMGLVYNLTLMHLWTRRWHVTIVVKSFFSWLQFLLFRYKLGNLIITCNQTYFLLSHCLRNMYRLLKQISAGVISQESEYFNWIVVVKWRFSDWNDMKSRRAAINWICYCFKSRKTWG